MKKRIVSILLCLCMVLGMMPLSAFAADSDCDHSFEYGYYYFDDAGHYLWCDHCMYYPEDSLEAHVNEDDDVHCDVCGYIYPHTHIYENNEYYGDDNLHYPSCDLCGEDDENAAEHHFDTDSDDLCDACHIFMGDYNLLVTNGAGHERVNGDDVFFGDTLTAEYSDTVEYWWTVYDPDAGGEGEYYTLSNEKSYTIQEEDFADFEKILNLHILNPVTKETLEYISFYVTQNYDALPKVDLNLCLKAVDAEGNEVDCKIDACLNDRVWIGTENLDYEPVSCVVGANALTYWDYFPFGYVYPEYEIHFTCDEEGNIAVTSGNAQVEVDGDITYLVITLEPLPPIDTALKIGNNVIQDGYVYTYTTEQDGTLYATITELYGYWGNDSVPEEYLNEWVSISINDMDIDQFANTVEVSTGDVVTIVVKRLDSDAYMGNIYLSWDGSVEGPDLTPAEITDVFIVVDGVTYASGTVTIKPFSTISYMVVGTNLENLTGQERVAYAQGYDIPIDESFGWEVEPDLNTATWDITYLTSAFKDCNNFEVKYKNDGDTDWTGTGLYLIYDADASLPLVLGDNDIQNDIPYAYTAQSDGTLQLNVTELFYDNGEGSGAVTEDLLGDELAIRINGNDVNTFSNTLEVSAGDTVTFFVDAIALYAYEGTVNLAFTAAEPDEPEDPTPAQIKKATISVDGVTYNEGILKVTSKSTVVFTVSGTNFKNLSESNVLNYAPGKSIPLTDEAFVVDTTTNTATWTLSAPATQLEGCNLFEPTYRNNINSQTSTGHQLIYQIDTQETAGKVLIELTDRYGDGWNGAALEVYQDGALVETLTVEDGSYNTYEMPYDEDASYSFKWNQGRYSEECGFTIHVNGEIIQELSDASSLENDETFLVYENGAIVDPEDFPARITGVTITVDGETYTEGEVTIKSDTQSIIYTVTGENFANLSDDNGLFYALGNSKPLTYEGFVVDAEADTATWDVSEMVSSFENCDNFEVRYTNDGTATWLSTGIYLTYEETPACTHADILACEKICAKCGQEVQPDAEHVSNSAPCMDGVCVYGCGTVVPATADHTPAAAVRENEKAATCYADGSYDEVVYCSVEACKHEISRTTKPIGKLDHTPAAAVRENEKAATCYADGSYDEVVYCSVEACKHEISRTSKAIGKLAHTPAAAVRENEKAATCYAEGSYDEVVYCSVAECKHEISRTPKTVGKLAHTPAKAVRENEKAATCYAEGSYDEVVYCSVEECKHEISRTPNTVAKVKHTPAEPVRENEKAATCYAEGSYDEVVYCSVAECKHEISRTPKTIGKLAHTPAEAVEENRVEATCSAEGSYEMAVYCAECDEELSRTKHTIPTKDHTVVIDKAVEATCTAAGKTEGKHCSVCGEVLVAQQEIPAKSHTAVPDAAVEATCTTAGKTSGSHCSVCGEVIMAQVVIPAAGHNWVEATCTTPKTCEVCGITTGGVAHGYDHAFDYKCDACGTTRIVDMTRPMVDMYRMYDPNSGEHLYTASDTERENLLAAGWKYEGIGFTFPLTTGAPVYRLYDPATGEHLYTMDMKEVNELLAAGWNNEGIAFNSGFENEVPQYRLHNPNATRGAYHFTASAEERDMLTSLGWEFQGIAWYSMGA